MNERIVTGATLNRHRSKQDYETPEEFLEAATKRFGPIEIDLAATVENAKARLWLGPNSAIAEDALAFDWNGLLDYSPRGTYWLNPPFGNIGPWALRCERLRLRMGWTLLLVPASVDANWYYEHVHLEAFVMPLRQRIRFVGAKDCYPKPLMLVAYGYGMSGFDPWGWK